jgi:hypothetical protein
MMTEIEPRFKKSSIRIIFGDGKIQPSLISDLGIQDTCVLRGDKWHLTNAVWPDKFGSTYYPLIQNFLIAMLDSSTQAEWVTAASHARNKLEQWPHLLSFLDDIVRNPSYYAGYFLKLIVTGSLGKNGSSAAESNHSSVVAYNGNGATWCIADQLHHLMMRCQNMSRSRDEKEQNLQLSVQRHKTKFLNEEGVWDKNARQVLSNYAYQNFWTQALLKSQGLQKQVLDSGDVAVWPTNIDVPQNYRGTKIIKVGERCNCRMQTMYLCQCEHEIVAFDGYHSEFFHNRWYNQWSYKRNVQDLSFLSNQSYSSMSTKNMSRYDKNNIGLTSDPEDNTQHADVNVEDDSNTQDANDEDNQDSEENDSDADPEENNEESNTEIHEENMENTCDNEEMSQNIFVRNHHTATMLTLRIVHLRRQHHHH